MDKEKKKSISRFAAISEKERKTAYRNLKQECFFEYDIIHDVFRITRNSGFLDMDGIKITRCTEKMKRLDRIHEEDMAGFIDFFRKGTKDKYEFRYIKDDGTYTWCLAKGAVIRHEDGEPKALVGSITDINQEKIMHEMLVEQALLDPLTKLFSRAKAQSVIEAFLREEGSFGNHALLIINIKSFRYINKHMGRTFGDGVLVNVAETLVKSFRKMDIISRVGGDDFMVFVKDIPKQIVLEKKIDSLITTIKKMYVGENISITCNVGVACFPKDGRNFGALFRNADSALYKAEKTIGVGSEFYDSSYNIDEFGKKGEFYHEYVVQDYKKNGNTDFSREITDFAVDIMLNSKDVASAIKLLLDKVGRYYDCDNVFILETDDNQVLYTSYSWNGKEGLSHFNAMQSINLADIPPLENYFDERGIRIISNTTILKHHPGYSAFMNMMDSKSLLQCAFYDEGEFRGCVCVGYKDKIHEWLREEIDPLVTITKLISVYLIKLKASEKIQTKIERLTNYDRLTGLPTLHKFSKDVEEYLENNPQKDFAVVYMDINKFKYINDTLGYEVGDELLKELSKTVSAESLDIIFMGRISADNFVLLMNYESDEQICRSLSRLNTCYTSKMNNCNIGRSLFLISGIAKIKYKDDVIAVIDNANVARKNVKKTSESAYAFYDKKMEEQLRMEIEIYNSMERALEENEFKMYLQPKISLVDNQIVGAEALARWQRKDGKMVFPDQFIPLFEKSGFIIQLDFYIYERACMALQKWMKDKLHPVSISVNVSRVHLNTDDFVERLNRLVDKYKIPHEYLELELTESIFLDNTQIALTTMKELKELGYQVSIDDFGAGYSSLNLLKDMTTDVLKIDKGFFRKGEMKKEEKIIVSSIVNMAKQLEMKVLSEGVETKAQSEFLRLLKCDMAQGYLFAKPMPEEEFSKLLKKENVHLKKKRKK
ncbi:MAG: GGDEF domain-containing protein [Lachnospiraceae bacterium]|nr:GGDEF domain-containing protein [Lachnospiraceae bacterium]